MRNNRSADKKNNGLKKTVAVGVAAALLAGATLSGCTNESLENEYAYRQMGINYMNDGDYASAVTAFDNALSQRLGKVTELEIDINYYKALAQYESGDTEGALATYSALIDYKPKVADAYYLRGCVYAEQGDTENAKEDFDMAISLDGENYELYIKAAQSLSAAGDDTRANEYINAVIAGCEDSDDPQKLLYLGQAYIQLENYEEAYKALSVPAGGQNIDAAILIADISDKISEDVDVTEYFDAYLAENEDDFDALLKMGNALQNSGSYKLAAHYLKLALDVEGATNTAAVLKSLVSTYEYSGKFKKAYKYAKAYVENYPGDAEMEREKTFLSTRV